MTLLRCKVSSDQAILDELHTTYPWIPNSECIRPSPCVLDDKNATLLEIHEKWFSLKDYILFKVFSMDFDQIAGRFVVMTLHSEQPFKIFKPNAFPYNIEVGNHWVMWYNSSTCPYEDDSMITSDIEEAIRDHLQGATNFDFVWYENPKMSVPDFYHVQVFWITL